MPSGPQGLKESVHSSVEFKQTGQMFCILNLRDWYLVQEDTYEPRNKMSNKNTRHLFQKKQLRILHQFETFSYKKFGQQVTATGLILMSVNFSVEID